MSFDIYLNFKDGCFDAMVHESCLASKGYLAFIVKI